jgi:hypothetical protein
VSSLLVGLCALVVALITLAVTIKSPKVDTEDALRRARVHLSRLVEQELDEEVVVRGLAQPEPIRLKWTRASSSLTPSHRTNAVRIVRAKNDGDITTASRTGTSFQFGRSSCSGNLGWAKLRWPRSLPAV